MKHAAPENADVQRVVRSVDRAFATFNADGTRSYLPREFPRLESVARRAIARESPIGHTASHARFSEWRRLGSSTRNRRTRPRRGEFFVPPASLGKCDDAKKRSRQSLAVLRGSADVATRD